MIKKNKINIKLSIIFKDFFLSYPFINLFNFIVDKNIINIFIK